MSRDATPRRKLTPKQRVLKAAPDAECCYLGWNVSKWEIRAFGAKDWMGRLGFGATQRDAWFNASQFIKGMTHG